MSPLADVSRVLLICHQIAGQPEAIGNVDNVPRFFVVVCQWAIVDAAHEEGTRRNTHELQSTQGENRDARKSHARGMMS